MGVGAGDVRAHRQSYGRRVEALCIRRTRRAERRSGERTARVSARPDAERHGNPHRARVPQVAAIQGSPAERAVLLPRAAESQGPAALPARRLKGLARPYTANVFRTPAAYTFQGTTFRRRGNHVA